MASTLSPPSLPPSVEEAYRKKCLELRRRQAEVEEANDAARVRRTRILAGVRKMRLERAILLDTLGRRMRKNGASGPLGVYDEDSEDSSDAPPTPQERPLRTKRTIRREAQAARASTQPGPDSASKLDLPQSQQDGSVSHHHDTPERAPHPHGHTTAKLEVEALPSVGTDAAQRRSPAPPTSTGSAPTMVNETTFQPAASREGAKELFKSDMIENIFPSQRDRFRNLSPSAMDAQAERAWQSLSAGEQAEWADMWEERMADNKARERWDQPPARGNGPMSAALSASGSRVGADLGSGHGSSSDARRRSRGLGGLGGTSNSAANGTDDVDMMGFDGRS